jgi:hypothetical protein
MIRGSIPCTWDQQFVEKLNYKYRQYTTDNHARLVIPQDINRYNIAFWMARDLPIEDFNFINENFRWLKKKHFQINKFEPGHISPMHIDQYPYYSQLHNLQDDNEIVRVIIFMQDWKNGHYLEVEDTGITNWKAGDWVAWDLNTPHIAANIGLTDRYTMQLTGIKHDIE